MPANQGELEKYVSRIEIVSSLRKILISMIRLLLFGASPRIFRKHKTENVATATPIYFQQIEAIESKVTRPVNQSKSTALFE